MLESLQKRRTYKVIGDTEAVQTTETDQNENIDVLLAAAGNAPFHYACDRQHMEVLASPVPWRVYKLDSQTCRKLMSDMLAAGDMTKIPNMLAAAQFLFQITWLPDPGTIKGDVTAKEGPVFDGTLRNMEHIAAASAFTQSLLLAAEDAGYKTYWSSGGPLRGPQLFEKIGIPATELLLGSVFLFPSTPENTEIKPGAMAEKRGVVNDWSRWTEIT